MLKDKETKMEQKTTSIFDQKNQNTATHQEGAAHPDVQPNNNNDCPIDNPNVHDGGTGKALQVNENSNPPNTSDETGTATTPTRDTLYDSDNEGKNTDLESNNLYVVNNHIKK